MNGSDGMSVGVVKAAKCKNKKHSLEKQSKRALRRSNTENENVNDNDNDNDFNENAVGETLDEAEENENIRDAGRNQNKGGGSSSRSKYAFKLMGYISAWNYREVAGGWKFNKVLQTWAIENIFDAEKIDIALYEALVPYIITIKGASVDRLLAKAEEIITFSAEDVGEAEASDKLVDKAIESGEEKNKKRKRGSNDNSNQDSRLKRAAKIKFEFSTLNKTENS